MNHTMKMAAACPNIPTSVCDEMRACFC